MTDARLIRFALFATMVLPCAATMAQEDLPPTTSAPTTQASRPTHAKLVKAAAKKPLAVRELKKTDGSPLSDTEASEIREAEQALDEIPKLRAEGKYAEARERAEKAGRVIARLLGPLNYMNVTASVQYTALERYLSAKPDELATLRQADSAEAAAAQAVRDGDFFTARVEAAKAISKREPILGDNHPDLIEPLRILGYAQTELQALDDAEAQLARALELCEQTYGKSHPRTAAVLDRQGWLNIYRGKPNLAEPPLRRALYIFTSTLGEGAEAAETMDNLGTALGYKSGGDFLEAVNSKLRALVIREQVLGPTSKDAAISLSNLAWLYSRGGLTEEVIPMRSRALENLRASLGPDHRDTLVEMSNLAQAYRQFGKPAEAAELYRELVAHDQKENNPADAVAVSHLTMLGSVLLESDKQSEGEEVMRRAFDRLKTLHEKGEHGAAAFQGNQLAIAYQARRMLDDACKVRRQLYEWERQRPGRVNQNALRSKVQFGLLLAEVGDLAESRKILTTAVEDAAIVYGKGERDTTVSMIALASTLEKIGELTEAGRLCSEILRITESKYPEGTLPHAFALAALARVQLRKENYDLAKFSLEEAIKILQESTRQDPVTLISCLVDLSKCEEALGDKDAGIARLREALTICDEMNPAYPLQHKGMRVSVLNPLRKALAGKDQAEADALTAELKKILEKLRDCLALSAEDRESLKELGISESRG